MYEARLPRDPVACTVMNEHLRSESETNRAVKTPLVPATTDLARRGPPRTIARTRTGSPAWKEAPRTTTGERSSIVSRAFEPEPDAMAESSRPATRRTARTANERMRRIMPGLG